MENPTTTTVTMPAHMVSKQPTEMTIERVVRAPPQPVFKRVEQPIKAAPPPREIRKPINSEPQYHSFAYDSGNETTKVQIKLPPDQRYLYI